MPNVSSVPVDSQRELKAYVAVMGGEYRAFLFDGGVTVTITVGTETFRATHEWGDDEARLIKNATRFLNGLPWPGEDDPRVIHEGASL